MGYIGSDPKTNESVSTAQLVDDSVTNAKIVDNVLFTSVTSSVVSASNTIIADTFTGTFSGALSSSAQISSDISGSFTAASSSFSSRTTTLESASGSDSTRITTLEGRVNQGVKTTDSPTFAGATVTGTLTANEIHTTFVSSSVATITGSNVFGDAVGDLHSFTGSVSISGSQTSLVTAGSVDISSTLTTAKNITVDYSDPTSINAGEIAGDNDVLGINIKNQNTGNGTGGMLKFIGGNGNNLTAIGHVQEASNSASMLFFTETGGTFAERMRVDHSGLIGIGTNGPASMLHLHGTDPILRFEDSAGGDVFGIYNSDSLGLGFYNFTDSRQDVTIKGDGNVGIGETSPSAKLHVALDDGTMPSVVASEAALVIQNNSATSDGCTFTIVSGNANNSQICFGDEQDYDAGVILYNNTNDALTFRTNGSGEDMRIDSSGNVGIGTNSMSGHVHTYSDQRYMLYLESTYGTDRKYWFRNDGGTLQLGEGAQGDAQVAFTFDTANNEFGIGTRGPEGFIDVHSGGSSVFKVQGDGVAVGNCNPGNYGTLHVISTGDTSITGSTFYDGYGETGVSGNTVGPHTLCLSSTAEASSDVGIEDMGPSMVFRGQPGTGLDGGATFAGIAGTFDQSNSTYAAGGNLRFFTSSGYVFNPYYGTALKEAMRIDKNQNVGIGQTSPLYKLDMYIASATHIARFRNGGDNYNMHGIIISCGKNSPVSAGDCNYIFFQDGAGTSRGGIRNSSTADNPEFFNGSDLRMKKDVTETKVNGLETINAIPLKEWNWNSEQERPKTDIGIVADDLEKVLPELVSRQISLEGWEHCVKDGEEPLKTIPTETKLTLILMKAVQELSQKNEVLEKRIKDLEE